ncbi:MAG: hypothetical protein HY259_03725 [Chloroflexi bacterium]|nr:hypothetical protein [Chloroflexota bacterium]
MSQRRFFTDYRWLFDRGMMAAGWSLARDLESLMSVQQAPPTYREELRHQLMRAAGDERFQPRPEPAPDPSRGPVEGSRRFWLALGIVIAALLSVVGFIGWRNRWRVHA